MEVTHFGHSCVLLDTGAARLLIDPGNFSTDFEDVTGLDAVLVTHQHPDHLDLDRLPALLRANPDARLIVDSGTAGQLDDVGTRDRRAGRHARRATPARASRCSAVEHAVIHPDIPVIPNNAYLVDGTHLHPGDALTVVPTEPLEVLFLPTAAPWQKLSEAVTYLRAVAPRTAVPIPPGHPRRAGHVLRPARAPGPGEDHGPGSADPATPTTL